MIRKISFPSGSPLFWFLFSINKKLHQKSITRSLWTSDAVFCLLKTKTRTMESRGSQCAIKVNGRQENKFICNVLRICFVQIKPEGKEILRIIGCLYN